MTSRGIAARDLSLGGLMAALAVALPWFFHWIPAAGPVLLPMHLPVLIAGLLVAPPVSAAVGLITPLVSSLITGMPPLPMAVLMVPQLALLAACAGLAWRRLGLNVYLACIVAMAAAQLLYAAELALLGPVLKLQVTALGYLAFGIAKGLPGMALQLALAPPVLFLLARRRAGGYEALRGQTWLRTRADTRLIMMFHGHLGPFVALGLQMGRHVLRVLNHPGHFGLNARVEITPHPPQSCLVDGLQLSTGCSYGKRNIEIVPADTIRVRFSEEAKPGALLVTLAPLAQSLTANVAQEVLERRFFDVLRSDAQDLFILEREGP